MRIKFTNLIGVLVFVAASSGLVSSAIAQSQPSGQAEASVRPPTFGVSDLFEQAFYNQSGDIFRNASLRRQADLILGSGSLTRSSFPETQLLRDAKVIETLYRDLLDQQVASDPIIRTPDLENPFNTSLRTNPALRPNRGVVGSEFIFETSPSR